MPHATCAHCNVSIVDHSTMVEQHGQQFCCANCAQMASGRASASGGAVCAHCQMPISDTSTQVTREDQTFCCTNCATAMAAGAGQAQ